MELNNLYVIIGKSGTGKTSLLERFREDYGLTQAESYTDRKIRYEGEAGHHFVTPEEFDKLEGKLLPTVFSGNRYTMTKELIDNSEFLVLDIPGIRELKEKYTGKEIVVIGLYCSQEDVTARMAGRGDSGDKIQERITHDAKAFEGMMAECDYLVNAGKAKDEVYLAMKNLITGIEMGEG